MITPDSRYAEAETQFAIAHSYDAVGVAEKEGSKPIEHRRDTVYRITTAPETDLPPHLYMAKVTDNVQLLAYRTLQDPHKWWRIADINTHVRYPLDIEIGTVLRLPD